MRLKQKVGKNIITAVTVGYCCDNCGVKIYVDSFPMDWHRFNSNHSAWGNDSCESYESHDVCSANCYISKIKSVVKSEGGYDGFEVNEMSAAFAKKLTEVVKCK